MFGVTADALFRIATLGVLPAWLLLAVAPRAALTRLVAHSIVPGLLLGGLYGWLLSHGAFFDPALAPGSGLTTLDGVMKLLAHPAAALAGWVHVLVFDLFVGAWLVRDARQRRIPHLSVLPSLALTLLAGPLGLIVYILTRMALRRGGLSLDPPAPEGN